MRPDPETANKQVLADAFRDLVRYTLLKTYRNVKSLGVSESNFTVAAMDESLASSANAKTFGKHRRPTVKQLLKKAHKSPMTFSFYWKTDTGSLLEAGFDLSYETDDLEVKLLWLALPERVPVSPRSGVIDGRKPLEEAVFQLLRLKGGRLSPYPPPA